MRLVSSLRYAWGSLRRGFGDLLLTICAGIWALCFLAFISASLLFILRGLPLVAGMKKMVCKVVSLKKRMKSILLEIMGILALAAWCLALGADWVQSIVGASALMFVLKIQRIDYTESGGAGGVRPYLQDDDQKISMGLRIMHDYIETASVCALLTAPDWLAWLFTKYLSAPWF